MADRRREAGNVFFMILLGIALFAALSVGILRTTQGGKDISKEKSQLLAGQIMRYAKEAKDSVTRLYVNGGVGEADLRFAHPKMAADYGTITTDPQNQVFAETGGGLPYQAPPVDATTTATNWEVFGITAATHIGTSAADLVLVLPNVKQSICQKINEMVGYAKGAAIPADTGTCVYSSTPSDRFAGTFASGGSVNTMPTTDFVLPAAQACVSCSGVYHFYSVLLER